MTTATNADRLRAAGWELAHTTLRMVTLPSDLGDDELFYWRKGGRVLTEAAALTELEEEERHG